MTQEQTQTLESALGNVVLKMIGNSVTKASRYVGEYAIEMYNAGYVSETLSVTLQHCLDVLERCPASTNPSETAARRSIMLVARTGIDLCEAVLTMKKLSQNLKVEDLQ